MTSSVFFKFKSQKEPTRVPFDGTGISVFELKRTIIEVNRLGDGTDFDLAIYNEDTNEEYDDDTTIIPRSTSIIARRLPPAKAGRGGAARYVSGKVPVKALNTSRAEKTLSKPAVQAKVADAKVISNAKEPQTEEEKIAAMFQAGAEQWEKQQEEMASATPVYNNNNRQKGKPNVNVPSHPPPPGYICYRCGEKGHWIQECPTNNDPNFDGRPRVKRTTGIPRSFLKTIEKPVALSNDGLTDTSQQPSSVMVNAEGEYVVAEPDKASWEQYQAKTKMSAVAQAAAETGSKELQERGLECPIDKKLFIDPTKTPCCKKTYCNDCIINALIERDFKCPGCEKEGILLDDVVPDEETAAKVKAYLEEKERKTDRRDSPSVISDVQKSPAPSAQKTRTPSPTASPPKSTSKPDDGASKKRPAEEPLESQRVPEAPAAMQRKASQQKSNPSEQSPRQQTQRQVNLTVPKPSSALSQVSKPSFLDQGISSMAVQHGSNNMAMPMGFGPMMGMNSNMFNMPGMSGFTGKAGIFPDMNALGFMPHQQQAMYGSPYGASMMGNGVGGGYGQTMNLAMGGGAMGMGMNMGGNNNMFNNANGMPQMMGYPPQAQQIGVIGPQPFEEDNAYFRKPVNPHRHQARQRRVRPSDYREL